MTSARHPLPIDLVALVSFDGRVYPNEAKPWDRLGMDERARPLETAIEQWFSFATGKQTWVSVSGATIRGLITARQRAKRSVWEVETLIHTTDDYSVAASLFTRMASEIGKQGAERIFLRLEEDSRLVRAAREAGFFTYMTQTLYRRCGQRDEGDVSVPLRPRARGDLHGMYQLYRRAVPANIRAIEGPTQREWQAAMEPWGGRYTDLVLEEDGSITAWMRLLAGHAGRFTVLTSDCTRGPGDIIAAAAGRLGTGCILSLVPDYAAPGPLVAAGFEPAGQYVLLAKRTTRPVEELVPEKAKTAVPAS